MSGTQDFTLDATLSDLVAEVDLGPVGQISFAVADFESAVRLYSLAFGPFVVRRFQLAPEWVSVRGRPTSATLWVALAHSGDVEIEIIWVEQGEYPTAEYVEQHGDGVHHLAFYVSDLDTKRAQLESVGFRSIVEGGAPNGARFCYLEGPGDAGQCVFELFQRPVHV